MPPTSNSGALPRTFFSPQEVADSVGLAYRTVLQMCREGALAHIRVGAAIRIPATAIDQLKAEAETARRAGAA